VAGFLTDSLAFLEGAAERVAALDGRLVAVALALQGANLVLRALAWRNVLAGAYPARRIPVLGVGAAYAVGVALNGLLPARGGEVAKVALVRTQLPSSSVVTIASSGAVVLAFDAALGAGLLVAASALGAVPAPPLPSAPPWPILAVVLAGLAAAGVASARIGPAAARRLAQVRGQVAAGGAILREPHRYLASVASLQVTAWACRIGAVWALLAAFGLAVSPAVAAAVVLAAGASTVVPGAPGGAGTQQLLLVYALQHVASAADALSFAIAMQAGVTAVNVAVGLAAAMVVFRTLRPVPALRAALRDARRP
jgi:uncharacterized membrane protein YbhN (UPF0104 family)